MDAVDAGRLLVLAVDVTAAPGTTGRAGEYRQLVDRYMADASFRRLVDDLLEGVGCRTVTADQHYGLIVETAPDGPWAWPGRASDLPWNKNFEDKSARAARMLVVIGLLAYVAPSAADLDDYLSDPQMMRSLFTAGHLEGFIRDYAEQKEAAAEDPTGTERPLWWHWLQLPPALPTMQRAARGTTHYLVHEILSYLHKEGLLMRTSGTTVRDFAYRPRRRLIAQMRALLADDLLQDLQAHAVRRGRSLDDDQPKVAE